MSAAAVVAAPAQERNVLVVGGGPNTWLEAVAQKLDNEARAQSEQDVVDAIVNLAGANPTFSAIELISHTGSLNNLLKFGNWFLGPKAFLSAGADFRKILKRIGTVRLAGCFSALGDQAKATLSYLESEFGVKAEGAFRGIMTHHLISSGTNPQRRGVLFISTAQAVSSKATARFNLGDWLADLGAPEEFEMPQLTVGLSSESSAVLKEILTITGLAHFNAPGILRIPDLWLELRDESGRVVGGIGLLFGAELLHLELSGARGGLEKVFVVPADRRQELRTVLTAHRADAVT